MTNEVKENGVNYIKTTEDISLSTEISKIVRELGQTMTTIKAIVKKIKKESKLQMQEQRYYGFRNRRWNKNVLNNIQTNNWKGVCWNCASLGHYSRNYPQNNKGNDQRNSCQGHATSEPLSP